MRHGGRAFLLLAEKLFGFADFGALQMADFRGDLVQRAGDHRECGQVVGMAIALDHLGRNCGGLQSQAGANLFFDLGAEVGERSHRAGKLAHAHVLGGSLEAFDVALRLGIPVGQLEAEGNRLGVNAVSAADHGRVFELPGAAFEDLGKPFEIGGDDGRRLADEQGLCGVDHIVGREAVVKPAGFGADDLRHRGGEGDHVVPDFGFDFVDALQVEVGALADGLGRVFWDHAGVGQGFGGGDFDGKPGAEAVFVAPDAAHIRAGIAWDHGCPLFRSFPAK